MSPPISDTATLDDVRWLGLVLRSETGQPHEWLPVGWAIRNRVDSGRYANTYEAVVLSRKQFSYFNQFEQVLAVGGPAAVYAAAVKGYAGDAVAPHDNDLSEAVGCASWLLHASRWQAPFGVDVCHYWSPQAMVPVGSRPPWAGGATRTFTPGGVDPQRFVFAAGVK